MRPSQVLSEVRRLYRPKSWADHNLNVLNPLTKDHHSRKGGKSPARALTGVYHGALIGTGVQVNTNNKDHYYYSKRKFKPNVHRKSHYSETLGTWFSMQTSGKALRAIRQAGGFDNYLLTCQPRLLSRETTRIRDAVRSTMHAYLDSRRLILQAGAEPSAPEAVEQLEGQQAEELKALAEPAAGELQQEAQAEKDDLALMLADLSLDSASSSSSSSSSSTDFSALSTLDPDAPFSASSVRTASLDLVLPAGITSRPHALDRVRPAGYRNGDRILREKRQADGLSELEPQLAKRLAANGLGGLAVV